MTWFRLPLFVWSLYATSGHHGAGDAGAGDDAAADRARARCSASAFSIPRSAAIRCLFQHLFWFYSHPGRLHHDPAGHGRGQRDSSPASPASRSSATSSSPGPAIAIAGDRLLRLGPPHVRQRPIAIRRPGVLVHELHRRRAVGDQGVQLDRDAAQGLDHASTRRCSMRSASSGCSRSAA